ncbi:methyltransferase [Candidatus Spongiihabitans sp.]|uniref:methyltransferase n=1 Tax=Candidatus Spongiihabitans sp. TaxID=3101308 RepID=UPI003C7056FF
MRVQSFHAPGLAPICFDNKAWHISIDGETAYGRTFRNAFGFYENLAAVNDERGWFHIHPDGVSAYAERHSWCGNFQGGRCVVCTGGRYYHIDPEGHSPYSQTYAYAGDFREGCAVVTNADGLCGHILANGTPAHPHRYRNLDVYHKGYARAQDENGWTHIDRSGMPAYENRYSSVEPFYNGRALTQTFNHKTLLINELGDAVVVIKDPAPSATENNTSERYRQFHELSSDMVGYWKTFAIAASVKLNVPEKLPLADTAMTDCFGESAANMKLLLAALAQMNITANTDGVWNLTSKGSLLLANGDFSLADAAVSWGTFATSGADAWVDAISGKNKADFFAEISRDISKVERSQKTLAAYAKNDYEFLADMLPLDNVRHLLDAGGGSGTVARMIVRKWQNLNITILDRADVLSLFDDRDNPGGRITKLGGDIFLDWQTGADAVLLARVLHDWNDQKAALILAKANLALPLGGKLFVVEADGEATGAMVSLHLLTVGGGRQRTRQEYQALMAENGFSFVEHRYLNRSASLLIGEKIK